MIVPKCRNCVRPVKENCRGILCDSCLWWFHLKCTALSVKEYNYFAATCDLWLCLDCRNKIFPFNSVEDHELVELLVYNSNTDCLCSDNNRNLSSIDIDLNLPSVTNFGYYSIHEFHSSKDIRSTISDKAFSALHFDIRSLAANFDDFFQM